MNFLDFNKKLCMRYTDDSYDSSTGLSAEPHESDNQQAQENSAGGGEAAKWILVFLMVFGIMGGSSYTPVGAVLFLILLLISGERSTKTGKDD